MSGEQLQSRMGEKGWFPDHTAERRHDFERTSPGARVAEAIALSRTATRLAAVTHARRER